MTNRGLKVVIVIFAVLLFSECSNFTESANSPAIRPETTTFETESVAVQTNITPKENALSEENLCYLGAFRLPEDGEDEKNMFSWSGEALAYNPNSNSLFIAGHNWYTNVAEISNPEPIISKNLSGLNQAEVLQDFKDIRSKNFSDWDMEIPRVGLEVVGDTLYYCFGEHFEENTEKGTHGYCDLSLNPSGTVCMAGDYLYSTNDYLFAVPDSWQAAFGGCDLLTGRFRDGGWSGMGPSLFAIRTEDILSAGDDERIEATPILLYDDSYNGDSGYKMNGYSHADSITGGAFVECDLGSSVVFAATHGFGSTWYGFSNGVVYPIDGEENASYPSVPPYPYDERGWWNDDFRAALIMYDPAYLAEVYADEYAAYSPQPYAEIDLSEYMLVKRDETSMVYLGGLAYDAAQNRLYVLELFADGDKPVVHVFTFN